MKTVEQGRVGELIVLYKPLARADSQPSVSCIVKVVRQTKTLLICQKVRGVSGGGVYKLHQWHRVSTKYELNAAHIEIYAEVERREKLRIAKEEREKDPRHQMLRKIQESDMRWEKLPNEQLKIICDILDTIITGEEEKL